MKVFLDLDGVLANFGEGVYRAFNKEYDYSNLPSEWFWYRDWGVDDKEFDSVCGHHLFASLRWMHDGKQILKTVKQNFSDITLLTSAMDNPGSWTGKVEWVNRHIPSYRKKLIITQIDKSLFADPDTLLIDDRDENIEEFVAAGGQGILVPRPWNELHGWAGETLQVVKNSLEGL